MAADQRLLCTDVPALDRSHPQGAWHLRRHTPAKGPLHPSQVSVPFIHRHHCSQGHPHPPQTSFLLSVLTARAGCQAGSAQSSLNSPCGLGEANQDAPQSCLHRSTQSPAESSPSPSSCRHQTTWLLSQFSSKEKSTLCKLGASTKNATPSLPHTKKHTEGSLCNTGINQHSVF